MDNRHLKLNYSSTLEGSVLMLTCENDTSRSIDERTFRVTCQSSGNWIPDPSQLNFTCSEFTTVPPGTEILIHSSPTGIYSTIILYLSHYQVLL
jgi:hypothetical protein